MGNTPPRFARPSTGGFLPRQRRLALPGAVDPAAIQAAAAFIEGVAGWRWWVTLTFRGAVGRATALECLKGWLRAIAKEHVREHVPFAFALDLQPSGSPHFHVLVAWEGDDVRFDAEAGRLLWRRVDPATGFARLAPYDPGGGAAGYMVDHHAEWDVNVACPRRSGCRKQGCSRAPSPW